MKFKLKSNNLTFGSNFYFQKRGCNWYGFRAYLYEFNYGIWNKLWDKYWDKLFYHSPEFQFNQ